jgi:hypothetical protein
LPDLKIIVCLRNPLEVAQSLSQYSNSSGMFGLNLWLAYNERLLSEVRPEDRIVTHHASFGYDARAELRRLVELLNLPASEVDLERALAGISASLRHNVTSTPVLAPAGVSDRVAQIYSALCAEAGPVYHRLLAAAPVAASQPTVPALTPTQQEFAASMQLDRLQTMLNTTLARHTVERTRFEAALADVTAKLNATKDALALQPQAEQAFEMRLAEKTEVIGGLKTQVADLTGRLQQLSNELDQLEGRRKVDMKVLETIHIAEREQAAAGLKAELSAAQATSQRMAQSKFWRLGLAYWRLRATLLRVLGPIWPGPGKELAKGVAQQGLDASAGAPQSPDEAVTEVMADKAP